MKFLGSSIGRGANNDVILSGMYISAKPFPSSFAPFSPFLLTKRVRALDMQVLIIARSNGMDARGWSVQYRRAQQLDEWHLGTCLFLSHFTPPPSLVRQRHTR